MFESVIDRREFQLIADSSDGCEPEMRRLINRVQTLFEFFDVWEVGLVYREQEEEDYQFKSQETKLLDLSDSAREVQESKIKNKQNHIEKLQLEVDELANAVNMRQRNLQQLAQNLSQNDYDQDYLQSQQGSSYQSSHSSRQLRGEEMFLNEARDELELKMTILTVEELQSQVAAAEERLQALNTQVQCALNAQTSDDYKRKLDLRSNAIACQETNLAVQEQALLQEIVQLKRSYRFNSNNPIIPQQLEHDQLNRTRIPRSVSSSQISNCSTTSRTGSYACSSQFQLPAHKHQILNSANKNNNNQHNYPYQNQHNSFQNVTSNISNISSYSVPQREDVSHSMLSKSNHLHISTERLPPRLQSEASPQSERQVLLSSRKIQLSARKEDLSAFLSPSNQQGALQMESELFPQQHENDLIQIDSRAAPLEALAATTKMQERIMEQVRINEQMKSKQSQMQQKQYQQSQPTRIEQQQQYEELQFLGKSTIEPAERCVSPPRQKEILRQLKPTNLERSSSGQNNSYSQQSQKFSSRKPPSSGLNLSSQKKESLYQVSGSLSNLQATAISAASASRKSLQLTPSRTFSFSGVNHSQQQDANNIISSSTSSSKIRTNSYNPQKANCSARKSLNFQE